MNSELTILQTDKEIQLVKQTVGADLTPTEFNLFIHMARNWRLDPLRRQIYAILFIRNRKSKDEHGKDQWTKERQVTYITGIDGYRAIADRTGCYRPGKVTVECDESEKHDQRNPRGIVSATATVWKNAQGEWFEYEATVYWDEFAPLKQVWEYSEEERKKVPTDKYVLDTSGQWGKMGRHMLGKCAEALALRRGWPDDLAGLYVSEEMDRARQEEMIDITPTEQAARADHNHLQAKLGGPSLTVDWCDGEPLANVPVGQFYDRVMEFVGEHREEFPERIALFSERNIAAMRQFYTHETGAAVELKKELERYKLEVSEMTTGSDHDAPPL